MIRDDRFSLNIIKEKGPGIQTVEFAHKRTGGKISMHGENQYEMKLAMIKEQII